MQTSLDQDEQLVVEGFQALLTSMGDTEADEVAATGALLHEAGWIEAGLPIAAEALPFTVLTALAETSGRRSTPLAYPLLESWVALRALDRAGTDTVDFCGSGTIVTLAHDHLWDVEEFARSGAVPFGAAATAVLVPGPDLRRVDASSSQATPGSVVDESFPVASFALGDAAELPGALNAADLAQLQAEYITLQTAEAVGAAEELFRVTLEYLESRQQFGRKLGEFQALQHRAADSLVMLETAKSLVHYAAWVCERQHPQAYQYALMAKGLGGRATWDVANDAIQLHGGVGFTTEAGLHHNLARITYRALSGIGYDECLIVSGADAVSRGNMLPLVD